MSGAASTRGAAGQVRVIGGEWRGRRLGVVDAPGLRPSGERVRETLFNWLQPFVTGARCLDLFAGSGVLALEALSRGAAHATLVERDARAADALAGSVAKLDAATRVRLVRGTAGDFLDADRSRFDIVFVDPPFDDACQQEVLERLVANGSGTSERGTDERDTGERGSGAPYGTLLADDALVYVEAPSAQAWPETLPGALRIHRERAFGEVTARLLRAARDTPENLFERR